MIRLHEHTLTLLQRLLQRGEQPSAEDAREYSVDELARAAGSSVRNVRAYQDRGLLPPPERRGRVGVYFDSHLKRLRLISQLLERGYSSANIKELLEAWEQGRDLDHVLGLDQAIIGEWNLETPGSIGFDELQAIFGDELNDRVIDKAQALGLLLFDGERMKIPSPAVPGRAGTVPQRHPAGGAARSTRRVAQRHRASGGGDRPPDRHHLVDGRGTDLLPGAPDLQELAKVFLRLRPLAEHVVQVELARGLKLSANEMLGERVGEMLRKLEKPS